MRLQSFLRAAAAGSCLLWGLSAATADDKADATEKGKGIAWAKTFAAAKDQAKAANKLIMVDFYTDWCGWCKKLDADTYSDKAVIGLADRLVSVKVDAEEKKEGEGVAKAYNVHGYPTILFIDPKAVDSESKGVVGKIVGYLPAEPFADKMKEIARDFEDYPKLQQRVEDHPDDVEAIGRLAVIAHMRGDARRAADLLKKGEAVDPDNAKGHLTKAYNAVADDCQEKQQLDEAIALFRRAAKTGKSPSDVAYGLESVAACLFSQNKVREAIPELEAALAIPDISKGDKEQAERMLQMARQYLDQQDKKKATGDAKPDKDK